MDNKQKTEIDILNREVFIKTILRTIDYYSNNNQNISFSIQGEWGCGKSWILDRVFENLYDMQDEKIAGGHYCVFKYNAWKYDYYDEPLVSLLISLKEQFDSENSIFFKSPKAQENYKAAKLMIKENILDCVDVIQKSPLFEAVDSKMFHIPKLVCTGATIKKEFEKYKEEIKNEIRNYDPHYDLNKLMNSLVSGLNKIYNDEKKTIVVIVDELDRCLPEHAIKVLERMHHISQNVDNIQFIYGIDKKQLQQSIIQIFGFSESRIKDYLLKFISFSLNVPESSYTGSIEEKYTKLFENFDYVNIVQANIVEKIKLIVSGINPRIVESIINKIIFTNGILNQTCEKLDYSILIFELFLVLSNEKGFDWKNVYFENDIINGKFELIDPSGECYYAEVFNKLIQPCPAIFDQSVQSKDVVLLAAVYEKKWKALCESALVFYFCQINGYKYYFRNNDVISSLRKNFDYIKQFVNYYGSLEM